ncbi:MAG: Ig-like domain-containing protein [Bacteroidales bacterium]|nr:Ig-like domain-containing protein [Bacteroidales bacterium]
MKRSVLIIAVALLASCTRTILPETDHSVEGCWAHITADSYSADYYLKFEMGKCYTYKSSALHYYDENYIWGCGPEDFKLVFSEYYAIRDGFLLVSSAQDGSDAVNLGKVSVRNNVMTVDENTYYRLDGCTDTVSPKYSVKTVTLTPSSLTLKKGEVRTLTAVTAPEGIVNPSMTWKSDNPEIVCVNGIGCIKALSAGTACIMAQAPNGVYGICRVTVNEK